MMKKTYTTPHTLAVSNLKNSCSSHGLPFIRTLSLVSVAVFLSNASPVSACDTWGNVAKYFGGGTNILKSIAPTYVIDGNVYRDVGSAFAGVGDSFQRWKNEVNANINNKFNQYDNKINQLVSNKYVMQNSAGTITIGANTHGIAVDFANSSRESRILMGVRDGMVGPRSDQAVNGNQLYNLGSGVADSLGGGAYYSNGRWSAPVFMIKAFDQYGNETHKSYRSVADAFGGVNNSFANLNKKIENIVISGTGDGLVKHDAATGTITIGANKNGSVVNIANNSNESRFIAGVRGGWINILSNQAVNGNQLYKLGDGVTKSFGGNASYENGKWSAPTFTFKVFDENGKGADKSYNNVADAFTGVSSSFTNLDKKIENIVINGTGDSLVKQDAAGLITIGGAVSGANVSIASVDNAARTLSGVNAGLITATSTDAINGSQLYSMSNVVAGYFSGDAGYGEDGSWNAPTFTVKVFDENGNGAETQYGNVAEALSGVSSSFTNLNKKIESVTGDSFIKQNSAGLITIGGSKSGDRIDIGNNVNVPRVLSGVKGGAFTKTSTEAVNGGQLYYMSQAFANYFGGGAGYDESGNWSAPTFTVKVFDKDGNESEKKYNNVADAFAGVNSAFTVLNDQLMEIKEGSAIGEKPKLGGGHSDIISEGFPFMRSASLMRSLPLVMDEEEYAMGDDGTLPPVTISPDIESTQVSLMTTSGKKRSLFGLVNGDISANSDEAINGSQLYAISAGLSSYFGGGAGYNEKDGTWNIPSFNAMKFDEQGVVIAMASYTNVASAFDDVRKSMLRINTRLEAVEQKETPSVASNGFPWDAGKEGYDASHDGKPSKIVNVEKGALVENSTDAVNGGQLWTTNEKVTAVETKVAAVETKVTEVETKVAAVENKVNLAVSYDVDKESGKKTNSITLKGADDSEPVLITNVKDGEIKKGSKDVVNGGQLHDYTEQQMKTVLEDANKYTDEKV
ncbi:hypothetical protein, partial [Bartonella sp. MR90HLJMH]|uniref:hypothetical protein n=1 Tax=Bartonella sp. MR90HLJMH TaxID=3243559 RepID=UPI0035D10CDA